MPRSAAIRLRDLRAIHGLVGECRELGDDAAAWCDHLAAGAAALVGGAFAGGWQITGLAARAVEVRGIRDWGWDNGLDRGGWERSVAEFRHDPFYAPLYARYFRRLAARDGVCLARTDLMADRPWHRSWMYRHVNRAMGVDHHLWCYRAVPRLPGDHLGLVVAREPGRADFTAREKAVVAEAYAALAPLVGGPLASFADPAPSALPPRARAVLRCLLEGDADKQVAARLGIRLHTVNQYVKDVYRHFGVASRAELLARWVRRGWGAWAKWADD